MFALNDCKFLVHNLRTKFASKDPWWFGLLQVLTLVDFTNPTPNPLDWWFSHFHDICGDLQVEANVPSKFGNFYHCIARKK